MLFYFPECRNYANNHCETLYRFSIVEQGVLIMISNELMDKHNIINVWSSSQKANNNIGFKRAFLGECADGRWLVVTTDDLWEESEVLLLNTRSTAMVKIRKRGFYTRISKIYTAKRRASV